MNRFAANHPERFERLLEDNGGDHHEAVSQGMGADQEYRKVSNELCCVCSEITTPEGRPCRRCEASMQEDRLRREIGR